MIPIYIIAACSKNHIIGNKNTIPWKLSSDLKRFKSLTSGNIVLMGRKTYESIGRALPNRINLVVSKTKEFSPKDALVFKNIEDAIIWADHLGSNMKLYVIGGEQIYKSAMMYADRILLTKVFISVQGDTFFPKINTKIFERKNYTSEVMIENGLKYKFLEFNRIT